MTPATETSGALPLAFRRIKDSLTNHDAWAIRLVFLAGIATILHKSGVEIPRYAMLFGVCLGVAALLYEMNAATAALRSFWNGRPLSAIGWSFIWLVAFAYSMNQWIGAASENENAKTNVHQTAFVAHSDARDVLAKAKRELDRIEGRMSWMDTAVNGKPVRSTTSAQSDLDNAKANRFWTMTNECKETKGPQTRAFCENVAAWKSEKALAVERETLKEELAIAKAEHTKAQKTASSQRTEVSSERNDMLMLTKYAGMNQGDAQALTAVGSIVAISIFLSFATMLRELEHLRSQGPRKRIFSTSQLWFKIRRALFGGTSDTYVIDDTAARKAAQAAFSRYAGAN